MTKEKEPISPEMGQIIYTNVRLNGILEGNIHTQDERSILEQLDFMARCREMQKRNLIRIPDEAQFNSMLKSLQAFLSDFRRVESEREGLSLEVQLAIDTA